MQYSIDTSAILDGYIRYYPPDVFPKLWKQFETIIQEGLVRATELVLHELERKDDAVLSWAKSQEQLFLQVDNKIQHHVINIMNKYPRLISEGGNANSADPFVIALAKQYSLTVITAEIEGSEKKPKIPYICKQENIGCIDLLSFIRNNKWSF